MKSRLNQKFLPACLALVLAACLMVMPTPFFVQGQEEKTPPPRGLDESFNIVNTILPDAGARDYGGDPVAFITALLNIILGLVAIVAAAVLVWGGIMYISSLGDEDKIKRAKQLIIYAIIGLLVIAAAAIVVNVIVNVLFDPA